MSVHWTNADWEAEGKYVVPNSHISAFYMDMYEAFEVVYVAGAKKYEALSFLNYAEAKSYCESRGGRLPSYLEWMAAATNGGPGRYPWGDAGAVCRKANWGLGGTCRNTRKASYEVGKFVSGDSALGFHDMAGNVAEWVDGEKGPELKGGSLESQFAAELRIWHSLRTDPNEKKSGRGVRCAYSVF